MKRSGGLSKWFSQNWVDIRSPKKGGGYKKCGRPSAKGSKRKYPKCVPSSTAARMTASQRRSAISRKIKAQKNQRGKKPARAKTFA